MHGPDGMNEGETGAGECGSSDIRTDDPGDAVP